MTERTANRNKPKEGTNIAKTPLMQLNENIIRNCYDFLSPRHYVP